jgi:predicted O-methyltransferase YrrM
MARTEVAVDDTLLAFLERLAQFGQDNDARESARPRRMLNITCDTGRLLWILARATGATRILEVGTSNAFSTIWLADAARSTGGRVVTLELDPGKIGLARANLAAAGLDGVVDVVEGRAADTLGELPGPFDIVFLDADRES